MRKKTTSSEDELRSQDEVRTIARLHIDLVGVPECDLNGMIRRRSKMFRSMA